MLFGSVIHISPVQSFGSQFSIESAVGIEGKTHLSGLIPTLLSCSLSLASAVVAATAPPAFINRLSDSNSIAAPVYDHVPVISTVFFAGNGADYFFYIFFVE